MYITLNFILLFLIVIFPGIIFRRFYYYGEFSKQFRIKEQLHHLFISNIIPGVIILVFSLIFLRLLNWISPIQVLYPQIKDSIIEFSINEAFLLDVVKVASFTLVLSFVAGYGISRLIRGLKLDIKYRLLRFRNSWYYLFSGEITSFEKFKSTFQDERRIKKKAFYPPYVDVLIENGSEAVLYSGLLLDYEVSSNDLLKLERIYLKDAIRYSKKEGETASVDIPGDLFVINTTNLININIKYPDNNLFKEEREVRWLNTLELVLSVVSFLLFLFFILSLFFKINIQVYDEMKWHGKLFSLLFLYQFIFLFVPVEKNTNEKDTQKKKVIFSRDKTVWSLLWLIFWGIVVWCFYIS